MPNTPAMIAGTFGQGRVLCFSPHPEYTEPLQGMIARAVTWAAKRHRAVILSVPQAKPYLL
jgi:hypothetical protein